MNKSPQKVISYLIDEGYANDFKSAENIFGSMSDEWLLSILNEGKTTQRLINIVRATKPAPLSRRGKLLKSLIMHQIKTTKRLDKTRSFSGRAADPNWVRPERSAKV